MSTSSVARTTQTGLFVPAPNQKLAIFPNTICVDFITTLEKKSVCNSDNYSSLDIEFEALSQLHEKDGVFEHNDVANIPKDRYLNIKVFESTRVKLQSEIGLDNNKIKNTDYINASHIKSCYSNVQTHYIATQAPIPSTIPDFWRMIFEQNINLIVMLTKEIENDKTNKPIKKATAYWPTQPNIVYSSGLFYIKLVSITYPNSEIIERKILLIHRIHGTEHQITHIQYTGWPDHGAPSDLKSYLSLLEIVDSNKKTDSPIVVQCSAGVGRTGTFCAIDIILAFLHEYNKSETYELNVFDVVNYLRYCRPNMVQSIDQYKFIYSVVANYIKIQTELSNLKDIIL